MNELAEQFYRDCETDGRTPNAAAMRDLRPHEIWVITRVDHALEPIHVEVLR